MDAADVHLVRSADRAQLVEAFTSAVGKPVGLEGVLANLDRTGSVAGVTGSAASWGFRWNDEDVRDQHWFPQGITVLDRGAVPGREILCTSWYSRDGGGSRISVVDLASGGAPQYRHVLLVEPSMRDDGRIDVRPVRVHAGGLAWHAPYLHVAATARGLVVLRLEDVVRVDSPEATWGYRYVLPVRFTYDGVAGDGVEPLRYSFVSTVAGENGPMLVAGEYGRGERTTRLVSYGVAGTTGLLREDTTGTVRPAAVHHGGVEGMQGVTVVGDTFYVTTSAGRWGRGDLHVGRPGSFERFARVLPTGVEDLTYDAGGNRLWSLTEYPGRRFVFAVERLRFS